MPRNLILLVAFLLASTTFLGQLKADDHAVAEQLRRCGAEVTETKGIVTAVSIADAAKLSDAEWDALGRLTQLKLLTLSGAGIDDKKLDALKGLTALEDLSTNQAQFSDEGLKKLTQFANLKQVKFFHTSLKSKTFNGSGLAHLAELKNLRRLTIAGCPFNDEGMAAVGKLTQLENFRTWHTFQTEAGNAHLKTLSNLKSLHLGQRLRHYDGSSNAHSLTDETLKVLAELKTLETLILDEARLTKSGLERLQALPHLKQLDLKRIEISADEIAELKKTSAGVKIVWQPLTDEERTALERFLKL